MKLLAFAVTCLLGLSSVHAASTMENCLLGTNAQFFTSELETIAQRGQNPVLLYNETSEVVGVIAVTAKRAEAYPHEAVEVVVESVELCATFEVSNFSYADDDAANLLNWTSARSVEVTQDEGRLVLEAKIGKKESYATRIDVKFKAYDVMTEIEDYTPVQRKSPDFDKEWGLPKGAGKFHFYIPANWKLIP